MNCGDLCVRRIEARSGLQVDLDDIQAVVGGGLDMLNVVDQRGENLFVWQSNSALELLRVQA